jgi:hypothetical protein
MTDYFFNQTYLNPYCHKLVNMPNNTIRKCRKLALHSLAPLELFQGRGELDFGGGVQNVPKLMSKIFKLIFTDMP